MMKILKCCLLLCVPLLVSCAPERVEYADDGRIVIEYWEKWGGFEADAMRVLVEEYNTSQDKYFVRYVADAGAQIDRKLMVSIAGGNPPELSGFWDDRLVGYVQNSALVALDGLMKRDGIDHERYLPKIIEACQYEGFTWGLPLTPATVALFYNKRLFREAGLDPERPPRTIAELEEYARLLTKRDENGRITQLGFSPDIPGWWNDRWNLWFGGEIWDAEDRIVVDSPENIACYEWIERLYDENGVVEMDRYKAMAGNFDSPQWPFFSERLAMTLQGVWMPSFIDRHAADLEWGVAPFPASDPELGDVTLISNDILVIPRDCPNIEGAWDFMKFTQRQASLEKLNLLQRKFSPLREVSEEFYAQHENPAVLVFRRLAESPGAHASPQFASFWEVQAEMNDVLYQVKSGRSTPRQALLDVKEKLRFISDRAHRRWERVADERRKQWEEML